MIKGIAQRLWVGTFILLQKRDSKLEDFQSYTNDRNQLEENIW